MLFNLDNEDRLDVLAYQVRLAPVLTPDLISKVIADTCPRLPAAIAQHSRPFRFCTSGTYWGSGGRFLKGPLRRNRPAKPTAQGGSAAQLSGVEWRGFSQYAGSCDVRAILAFRHFQPASRMI